MQHPYYEMTVPVLVKMLGSIDHLLEKAEAYVAEKGIDEKEILEARLAPDMYHFTRQVQIACDNAKGAPSRLAGVTAPVMEDTESSLLELRARVAKTIEYLRTFTPEQFEGAAERKVSLPYFKDKYFTGHDYLTHYALPNFFFHVTTAYDILRAKGLVIGKPDFLGPLPLQKNV